MTIYYKSVLNEAIATHRPASKWMLFKAWLFGQRCKTADREHIAISYKYKGIVYITSIRKRFNLNSQ